MIDLKNKICLVTDSNDYIGRSISKKLKYYGATVLETDIKSKKTSDKKNFFIKADILNYKDIN